ncbi:hypothetical protein BGZ76_007644, partial [Entomortierella beljakovae]
EESLRPQADFLIQQFGHKWKYDCPTGDCPHPSANKRIWHLNTVKSTAGFKRRTYRCAGCKKSSISVPEAFDQLSLYLNSGNNVNRQSIHLNHLHGNSAASSLQGGPPSEAGESQPEDEDEVMDNFPSLPSQLSSLQPTPSYASHFSQLPSYLSSLPVSSGLTQQDSASQVPS